MTYPASFEEKIGMSEIRSWLRGLCSSPLGRQCVDAMTMLTDARQIRLLHRQLDEMLRIRRDEDNFPDYGYYDLRPTLQRIRIEGTMLEIEELSPLLTSLQGVADLVSFFATRETYPTLRAISEEMTAFPLIIKSLHHIYDGNTASVVQTPTALIRDSASPELLRIRRELAASAGSVSRILQRILRSAQAEGMVPADAAPTMRDGRLMIPVAPGLKRKIQGIVHDESATGKTVFIEPQEAVEANNHIRELENDERREITRILRVLADEIRPYIVPLLHNYEVLARFEFIGTKARLAEDMHAVTPADTDGKPLIDWTLARHPLLERALVRHNKKITPLDIALDDNRRILIISGPNAGGKSVCLKTVGLLQYMLQCGLAIPVGEASRTGIFEDIMMDIGDEQSIEDELSTYSGHLVNMKQMMRRATRRSLLLIDEFGGGTEPQIGGAIAEAVLKRFVASGTFGIITTHYQNLKLFANATPGIVNGAMLYDRHEMAPLFQLQIGNPGSSFAIEIARKIGIPEEVIADATEIVGQDYVNADKWLQDIVRDKRYWEGKRQNIHQREKQMEDTITRYEGHLQDIQQQRRDILRRAKEEAAHILDNANAQIENTIREIRESQAEREATRLARQELEDFREGLDTESDSSDKRGRRQRQGLDSLKGLSMSSDDEAAIQRKMQQIEDRRRRKKERGSKGASQTSSSTVPSTPKAPAALQAGDTVRIKGQATVGTIEKVDGKNAIVVFGMMRTTLKTERLERAVAPRKTETAPGVSFIGRQTQDAMRNKSLTFSQEIDVRGMRVDEALQAVTHYIDDAIQVGVSRVRILHGTGTGALRTVLRQYLATVDGVSDAHDEHIQFGGTGITIVEF